MPPGIGAPNKAVFAGMPAPLDRLRSFQNQLGVVEEDFARINAFSEVFLPEKIEFAHRIFDHFHSIPATRIILDHGPSQERMIQVWSRWYESLFHNRNEEAFLVSQWRSGLNHVAAGIDHRYISLAYALVRKFIREIGAAKFEAGEGIHALDLMDRVLDLCLLVETDAFITSLSKCDHEIIRGIAHQVRNPLMVIGGNVLRLQRQIPPDDPKHEVYDTMLLEANRLERMVRNVATYNEVFQREPHPVSCNLEAYLKTALEELHPADSFRIDIRLDPGPSTVLVDADDLRIIFFHLLQNSLENVAEVQEPIIRVTSEQSENNPKFLDVNIFNNGPAPDPDSLESLFTPFFSTKALGTGFGLPIARLAVRKNLGHLSMHSEPGVGTTCLVTLPVI
ncbi:ATP-binding protein [Desulfonatronum parangueonense]